MIARAAAPKQDPQRSSTHDSDRGSSGKQLPYMEIVEAQSRRAQYRELSTFSVARPYCYLLKGVLLGDQRALILVTQGREEK